MSFGDGVKVLRDFSSPPFSSEDGANCVGRFEFKAEATPAKKMLTKAMQIFDEADMCGGSDAGANQMCFVVSDGRFDASQISELRILNRKLAEQHRLLVLLIMDNPDHSITKERRVFFEGDEVKTETYLEGYPFPYYVILKGVAELPEVLSDALRQWFEFLQTQDQG
eukprot:CAMPEP_0182560376 /NCGR_PEP_ID=MMETSP1324-20130603/3096_1 /TAXON_ID=236786 /ORGANISM="Florenciella sp., Strain RCC1587" /LENGTH=166 /DNA_ID=CAMNT_0024772721 /DNA_START=21 /DNA_END=521 /DNA_ORIENTATION=-